MITWYEDEPLPHRSLIIPIVDFVAKKERLTCNVSYIDHKNVVGPWTDDSRGASKRPTIYIPHHGSMNEVYQSENALVTRTRIHVHIIKESNIPEEMKEFLVILSDILHEMGHIKFHFNKRTGRSMLDGKRYHGDLEYRLDTEDTAEQLTTEWFEYFGFYKFINDISEL